MKGLIFFMLNQVSNATKLHIYSQNIAWEIVNLSRWMKENKTTDPHSPLFQKKPPYKVPGLSKKKGRKSARELIMEGDCGKFMKQNGFKIGCDENTSKTFQHALGNYVKNDQVVVFTQENFAIHKRSPSDLMPVASRMMNGIGEAGKTTRTIWGNGLAKSNAIPDSIHGKLPHGILGGRPFVAQYLHLRGSHGKFVLVINAHFPHMQFETADIAASLKKQIGQVDATNVAAIFFAGDFNRGINPGRDVFEFELKNGNRRTAKLTLMRDQQSTYFGWQRGYGKGGKGKGGKGYNPNAKPSPLGRGSKYGPDQMLFWVNEKLVDTRNFKAHFNVYRFMTGPGSDHLPVMGTFDIPLK